MFFYTFTDKHIVVLEFFTIPIQVSWIAVEILSSFLDLRSKVFKKQLLAGIYLISAMQIIVMKTKRNSDIYKVEWVP